MLTITLDDGTELRTTDYQMERERLPGPPDGHWLTCVPGTEVWTLRLDGEVGDWGREYRARFTVGRKTFTGTARRQETTSRGSAAATLIEITDVAELAPPLPTAPANPQL